MQGDNIFVLSFTELAWQTEEEKMILLNKKRAYNDG